VFDVETKRNRVAFPALLKWRLSKSQSEKEYQK
jgi:hypothetical protein